MNNKIKSSIRRLTNKLVTSKTVRESVNTVIITTISTIIATIVATIIATAFIDAKKEENSYIEKQEKLLYDLQTICIGCNKKWMDSVFGMPVFTNIDEDIKEDVYITDIALIRAFFDTRDNSCVMFFVTQTTEKTIPLMPTLSNTYYNKTGSDKMLGTLSYDDIKYSGDKLFVAYSFFTNGSGRAFYGEGYNASFPYLYPTYYASLDYGENDPWNMMGYIEYPDFLEGEINYYVNAP